jgi:hypothetical protein
MNGIFAILAGAPQIGTLQNDAAERLCIRPNPGVEFSMFDVLINGGEAAIRDLLGKQETLSLEFKSSDSREPIFENGLLNTSGRKILAKELSAFANSAGGVIIFGVDCRNIDGVDQAENLTPIANINRAETSIRDASSDLLQPRHDAIRVAAIPVSTNPTEGFIVVDVPRSERRPHRSEAKSQKEYFKRIGGRAYPMEHYDIEDAFRRATSPLLSLIPSIEYGPGAGKWARFELRLGIRNDGEVSAKSVSMQLWEMQGDIFGRDVERYPNATISVFEGRHHFAAPADFVVHPGETRGFHTFDFKISHSDGIIRVRSIPLVGQTMGFRYTIGAENMRLVEGSVNLTGEITHLATSLFGPDEIIS